MAVVSDFHNTGQFKAGEEIGLHDEDDRGVFITRLGSYARVRLRASGIRNVPYPSLRPLGDDERLSADELAALDDSDMRGALQDKIDTLAVCSFDGRKMRNRYTDTAGGERRQFVVFRENDAEEGPMTIRCDACDEIVRDNIVSFHDESIALERVKRHTGQYGGTAVARHVAALYLLGIPPLSPGEEPVRKERADRRPATRKRQREVDAAVDDATPTRSESTRKSARRSERREASSRIAAAAAAGQSPTRGVFSFLPNSKHQRSRLVPSRFGKDRECVWREPRSPQRAPSSSREMVRSSRDTFVSRTSGGGEIQRGIVLESIPVKYGGQAAAPAPAPAAPPTPPRRAKAAEPDTDSDSDADEVIVRARAEPRTTLSLSLSLDGRHPTTSFCEVNGPTLDRETNRALESETPSPKSCDALGGEANVATRTALVPGASHKKKIKTLAELVRRRIVLPAVGAISLYGRADVRAHLLPGGVIVHGDAIFETPAAFAEHVTGSAGPLDGWHKVEYFGASLETIREHDAAPNEAAKAKIRRAAGTSAS